MVEMLNGIVYMFKSLILGVLKTIFMAFVCMCVEAESFMMYFLALKLKMTINYIEASRCCLFSILKLVQENNTLIFEIHFVNYF